MIIPSQTSVMRVTVPLELLALFAGAPAIAAVIARAAWSGKPANFSREMYWTSFVAAGLAAALLIVWAQRMQPVGTLVYLLQVSLGILGFLLFGVSGGCGLGVFLYRRKSLPKENLS